MTCDVVIRGGETVDAAGLPAFGADVGAGAGRLARAGRMPERGGPTSPAAPRPRGAGALR